MNKVYAAKWLLAAAFLISPEGYSQISFIVIGDYGRNGEFKQRETAEQMGGFAEKLNIDFIISTGDNIYPDGVTSVYDPLWISSFENVYIHPSLHKRWYTVLGNHDYRLNPQAEVDYTNYSSKWFMPARYYYEIKNIDSSSKALFMFLDTSPSLKEYQNPEYSDIVTQDFNIQMRWADSILGSIHADWIFVTGHHPVVTGGYHGNTPELVEYLKPVLEKHLVNAYFCGHDHDMQHLKVPGKKTEYFISGAGSKTRPCKSVPETLFQMGETSGFMYVMLEPDKMKAVFIDYARIEIYQTIVHR